jgi:hypothetical protein
MKCHRKLLGLAGLFVCTVFSSATVAEPNLANATLAKPAIKGSYGGTFPLGNGNLGLFYQSKEGMFAYEFLYRSRDGWRAQGGGCRSPAGTNHRCRHQ